MKRAYRLGVDPVWWVAVSLYALHRLLSPWLREWEPQFVTFYFRDFLFIPALLPLLLAFESQLGLRPKGVAPSSWEILLHLVIWSLICEWVGPFALGMGVADPWDVAAYAGGALVAGLVWRTCYSSGNTNPLTQPLTSS